MAKVHPNSCMAIVLPGCCLHFPGRCLHRPEQIT